ncbi:MAG: dihydrolipoyllysine-residue acetyltransferase [Cellvibrionales bacterium]|nr:dihydrolipoyllysine-residue acetyltransferase [Cellvibrionales bacterium]
MSLADFVLPDIGEGIVECELVEWRIKEGDFINEDQSVADVSTDKALVEITAMHTGRVNKLYYQQGDIAKVHTPLFSIDVDGSDSEKDSNQNIAVEIDSDNEVSPLSAERMPLNNNALATPAVRRIARENHLDLSLVPSSGKDGRVLKDDVLNYLNKDALSIKTAIQPIDDRFTAAHIDSDQQDRIEPIKGVKAIMAAAMTESVATIPHFTYADEINMSQLMALRTELKERYAKEGIRLTMMPFFIKALSLSLKQFPILNSQVNEDCSELKYLASHNIGMAVDSPSGLLVPNIKDVQNMNIIEIAEQSHRLTEQARAGRISPNDLKGGTITVSNVGAIGGTIATPIISKPQVAIVALGRVQTLPRFDVEGNVSAQKIMTISWSGDHRVIDGATMAHFSNTWKALLENPASMLMTMR